MAQKIPIVNSDMFAIVDDKDYGLVSRFNWHLKKKGERFYARCKMFMGYLNGKSKSCSMYLHRLILRPDNKMQVDHRNHNGLDCRRTNIRICTNGQNKQNSRPNRNSSSKYKGVYWNKTNNKWQATIKPNGQVISLGGYDNEEDAALAYDAAAKMYFGDFAYLNFNKW